MRTFRTLFSGGELFGVGARAAGYTHVDGYEIDPKIAAVARLNGFDVRVADVCKVDYEPLVPVDHLHASPSCKHASQANTNAGETDEDLAAADAVCRAIHAHQGATFSIENVWGYRNFESFARILAALHTAGFVVDFRHINAADYGGWMSCPKHIARSAGPVWAPGIAPDFVAVAAMMPPDAQARILAWDVVASLVRTTQLDIAAAAIWQKVGREASQGKPIRTGRAESGSMNAAMSAFELTADTCVSIESLLNECLDDPSIGERWFTTSTAIRQITLLKIFKCLFATANTCHSTMPSDARENCPLCKYTAVPQTRKRLILRAIRGRDRVPPMHPTHRKGGDMFHRPWIGWYAAIVDLIPTLPPTAPAPWQFARLPAELRETMLIGQGGYDGTVVSAEPDMPSFAVPAARNHAQWRAYLWGPGAEGGGAGELNADARTPAFTLRASDHNGFPRAYIVGGGNTQLAQVDSHARADSEHRFTISASDGAKKSAAAYLLDGDNARADTGERFARIGTEPAMTLRGSRATAQRAYIGCWVRLTVQALGRFQTVPDDYIGLTAEINGNGVPCRLAQAMMESLSPVYGR